MPGLAFSNELISRDEALHTEFAILLYKKLQKQLPKKKVVDIIKEAVDIEKKLYQNKKRGFLKNNNLSMYLIKSAIYYFYYKSCREKGFTEYLQP